VIDTRYPKLAISVHAISTEDLPATTRSGSSFRNKAHDHDHLTRVHAGSEHTRVIVRPPGGRYLPRRAALSFHRPSTLPFFLKPFNYRGHSASSYVRLLLRARHHSPARARSCDGDAPFPARNAAPEVAVCVYLLPCRGRSNAALPSYPREE